MAFTQDEIRVNRDYFAKKLQAEKARAGVLLCEGAERRLEGVDAQSPSHP